MRQVDSFHKAAALHGLPASLLSDNGAVFAATPRKGKVLLQTELQRLGSPPGAPGPSAAAQETAA